MRTIIFLLFSISFCLSFSLSTAQTLTWTETTESFNLPEGIRIFAGERTSPTPVKAWYAEIDLTSDEYIVRPVVTPQGIEEAYDYAVREGTYLTTNAGYFSGNSSLSTIVTDQIVYGRNLTSVVRENKNFPVLRGALNWNADLEPSVDWIYHFGSSINDLYRFESPLSYPEDFDYVSVPPAPTREEGQSFAETVMSVGGGPVMITDSTVNVTWAGELFDDASGVAPLTPQPRTVIGHTNDKKIIVMVVDGRGASGSDGLSLPNLAEELLALGVTDAVNLDGGGSSQFVVNDKQQNNLFRGSTRLPMREVPSFFTVVPVSTGGNGGNTEEIIIDTDSTEAVQQYGTWSETANSGFYGSSPSLIVLAGEGESTIRYKATLSEDTEYEVFGWWVASSNRATSTPYIISHADGIDTVRVNQTEGNAQWNSLGTYRFTGTDADSVMISNDVPGNLTYIVADAVRFLPQIDTRTEELSPLIPTSTELIGNYPNPFNPSTTLKFQLAQQSRVSLKISTMIGQVVDIIDLGNLPAGMHEQQWNASSMASGVYIYQFDIQTQQGVKQLTGKMTLLK